MVVRFIPSNAPRERKTDVFGFRINPVSLRLGDGPTWTGVSKLTDAGCRQARSITTLITVLPIQRLTTVIKYLAGI